MVVVTRLPEAIVLVALGCASTATAQLDERQILTAARSRAEVLPGGAERARARAEGAGRLPDPTLGFERQQAFEPNPQSQDLLTLDWPVPLGGRGTERALAGADAETTEAEVHRARVALLREAAARFYSALHGEVVARLRRAHVERVEDVTRIVAAREAEGDAAGLERMRAELSLELARSVAAEAEVEARSQRVRLVSWLGLEDAPLRGDFEARLPALPDALARSAERADVLALTRGAARARDAAELAPRAALPELRLRAGYNRQAAPAAHGYALGSELTLPVFDRQQALRGEAQAAADGAEGRIHALRAELDAEVRASHALLEGRLAERERFEADVTALVDGTLAAYAQGEATVQDVLDVRRAALEVALREARLDRLVRDADVRLRAAMGDL